MADYIAVDLGAGSGRVIAGRIENGKLTLHEKARFPNEMVNIGGTLHWNLVGLFSEIKQALASFSGSEIPHSIGFDTWGVDFVLLNSRGGLAGLPVAYRDERTNGMIEKFIEIVPAAEIYARTGIQFLQLNTLFQVFAMSRSAAPELEIAKDLLFVPDYFNYLFTGEKAAEYTIATTSQLMNIKDTAWDAALIEAAGVSKSLFQKIAPPGTVLGKLTGEIQSETGLGAVPVILPACHDTGSAVAAVPAKGDDWAYISSGTWSLMGIETREPVLSDKARESNFTNEGGVNGTIRFLKNIMGLWPVQRIHAELGGKMSYGELSAVADKAGARGPLIDVEDPRFTNPASMIEAVASYCEETRQRKPETTGELVRCCMESLALQCRLVLDELRDVSGRRIGKLHIVGGGSRNELLCAMTASATGLPVLAGPAEATAAGNLMAQAQALGHISSIEEAREIIGKSFDMREYDPADDEEWADALGRYKKLKSK